MTRKRGNNEGTISKRKDGKWCAAITLGVDEDGKQKRKFYYGKTRQEVAEKLNQAVNDVAKGTFVPTNKVTTTEWLHEWLNTYKKPSVGPSTFMDYEYLIRVHINPIIGKILLKNLRPENLQRLYNEKSTSGKVVGNGGLSSSSVRHIHIVLHQALKQAVRNNLIPRNVSEGLELPQLKKSAELAHLKFHAASRHTFATRLLEANEHPKVVQEMLGHASIVLTLDTYSHVLPEIKQAAAAKLNFLFQKKALR